MVFEPLFKGMRATNIFNAFVLNAFLGALLNHHRRSYKKFGHKQNPCGQVY